MKNFIQTMVIFTLIFCILPGCKKDSPSTVIQQPPFVPTPPAGLAPYSGRWTGTINVTAKYPDLCYWSGGAVKTTQNWTVMGDSVHVEDTVKDNSGTYIYFWRGTIRNDTLEMKSKRNTNCFGVIGSLEIIVKAPISSLNGNYGVHTSANYPLCPPNCIFVYDIILSKPI